MGPMKRLVGRFAVLSVLAVLGLIAIAQAQREDQATPPSPETPATGEDSPQSFAELAESQYIAPIPRRLGEETTSFEAVAPTDAAGAVIPARYTAEGIEEQPADAASAAAASEYYYGQENGDYADPMNAAIAAATASQAQAPADYADPYADLADPYAAEPNAAEPAGYDDAAYADEATGDETYTPQPYGADPYAADPYTNGAETGETTAALYGDPTYDESAYPAEQPLESADSEVYEPEAYQQTADPYATAEPQPYAPAAAAVAATDYAASDASLSQPLAGDDVASPSGEMGPPELEGPQSGSLSITKQAPAEVTVGGEATFTIVVRNAGTSAVDAVEVRDRVPEGARLVSSTPEASRSPNGDLRWRFESLGPGEQEKIELVVVPQIEGEIGSVASVVAVHRAAVRTRVTRPQLVLVAAAPQSVHRGDDVTISIKLTNTGTGAATNVELEEILPEQLQHPEGRELILPIARLEPNESRQVDLVLRAAVAGRVNNVITARADGNLFVQQETNFEVVSPGLATSVTGPKLRYLDTKGKYTITLSNPGTAAAQDIELAAYLPREVEFVSAGQVGHYDPAQHAVFWSLVELPAGEAGDTEVIVKPVEPGEMDIRVAAKASEGLSSDAAHKFAVEGIAAITFSVTDVNDPVEVGGEAVYEIRVINTGSKAAADVRVSVEAPAGLRLVDAKGQTRHKLNGSRMIFDPLPALAPKADAVYRVRAEAVAAGLQPLRVEIAGRELQAVVKEEPTRVYSAE